MVNLPPLFHLGVSDGVIGFYRFYEDFIQNRFFPIFSFLFGIGFGLMWLSASDRSPRPRLALFRRFAFLAAIGGLHQFLHLGEALLPYAIVGTVVLLPSTWIPRRWLDIITWVLGAALLVAAIASGGGLTEVLGLFLLGFSTGHSGLIRRALDRPGNLVLLASLTAMITVTGFLVTDYETHQMHQWVNAGLGITMDFTYLAALVILMRTLAEAVLRSVLSPLGRMALSIYVGATIIIVAIHVIVPDLSRFDTHGGYLAGLIISMTMLALQVVVSTVWLRFFDQGPLESRWRMSPVPHLATRGLTISRRGVSS
ncbi:DUF418 domain-containing protein [Brevibacterium aurantiacum]|uniref:DUF418 domain-containing protein n=1 Tax=Brevibacterium aurantiacum TaxID=273384 RepID=UPI0021B17E68|nr:DUF418 domain-containing protein [Brevibacterium aurantiacum]